MTSIALIHKQEILDRLAKGDRLSEIAQQYNISKQAISKQLKNDPDYLDVKEESFEARMEQREKELESAETMVDITRASTLLKHTCWLAERECARRWGRDNSVNIQINNLNPESILDKASDLLKSTIEDNTKLSGE